MLAETAPALGDAVASLLDDPARARALGDAGRRVAVVRWSMDGVGADMVRLCQAAMAAREARA